MRPDIFVERAGGLHLFSGETGRDRQRPEKSLGVYDDGDARDLVDAAVADELDVME